MEPISCFKPQAREGDTDEVGHVNNQVYLRWMEEAARGASANNGWPTERYLQIGCVWVAREHWVEYLRPCFPGDDLTMYTWIQTPEANRCLRRYALKRGPKLAFVAATEWVFIDMKAQRGTDLPPEFLPSFETVPANDPRLLELGIARCVHWLPVVNLGKTTTDSTVL